MKQSPWEERFRALIVEIVRDEVARASPPPSSPPLHLTVAEYAKRWSISPSTMRAAIRDGRLVHERIGRAVRVPAEARIGAPKNAQDARRDPTREGVASAHARGATAIAAR
jgi:excisionase family DNA binding protein